jgi:hypothetical protein
MSAYQRTTGLKPIGLHRPIADKLLRAFPAPLASAGGRRLGPVQRGGEGRQDAASGRFGRVWRGAGVSMTGSPSELATPTAGLSVDDMTCRRRGAACPQGDGHPGEMTMFLAFVAAVVLAVVFFKLGVYSVLLGLFQLAAKVLFFGSGLFLLVYAGRWVLNRRRRPVTVDLRR